MGMRGFGAWKTAIAMAVTMVLAAGLLKVEVTPDLW
jgi:hypothetical protein